VRCAQTGFRVKRRGDFTLYHHVSKRASRPYWKGKCCRCLSHEWTPPKDDRTRNVAIIGRCRKRRDTSRDSRLLAAAWRLVLLLSGDCNTDRRNAKHKAFHYQRNTIRCFLALIPSRYTAEATERISRSAKSEPDDVAWPDFTSCARCKQSASSYEPSRRHRSCNAPPSDDSVERRCLFVCSRCRIAEIIQSSRWQLGHNLKY